MPADSRGELGVHAALALRLANEVMSHPDDEATTAYCKVCLGLPCEQLVPCNARRAPCAYPPLTGWQALSQMQLDTFDAEPLAALTAMLPGLQDAIDEKSAERHLAKVCGGQAAACCWAAWP